MNFERVILKRKQQILVLRLTFHASRQEDFDSLKDEQDTLCSRGFELFVEYTFGTRNPPDNCEENERRIAEFLNFLFDLSKQATKEAGFVNQRIALPYPETAIRADLSFNECVQWLHQDGLRIPKWFVWIVKTKKGTEYLRQMRQRIIKRAHGIDCQLSYSFRLRFFSFGFSNRGRFETAILEVYKKTSCAPRSSRS